MDADKLILDNFPWDKSISTDELFQIMLNLDYSNLLTFCQINPNADIICNDNVFWVKKLQKDLSNIFKINNIFASVTLNYIRTDAKNFYKLLIFDNSTLSAYCQNNTIIQQICNDNVFWIAKLQFDHPDIFNAYYTLTTTDSQYRDEVITYMKSNAESFYKSFKYFCQPSSMLEKSNSYIFNLTTTLYKLSTSDIIDINVFMNILLLVYTDESLEDNLLKHNIDLYCGSVIISALLPKDFMFTNGDVLIMDGILIQGKLNKFCVEKLIEALTNSYGANMCRKFETCVICIGEIYLPTVKMEL